MDLLTAANEEDPARMNQEDVPSTREKIELLWSSDPSGEPIAQAALDTEDDSSDEVQEDADIPYLADARSLIEDSKSFRLLLEKAKAALELTSSSRTVMEKVRLETFNALGTIPEKPPFSQA